ncbi:hypothetical protein [Mycobacterium colombiense]|uniref:hypothetical protein n=1 Tax=Mycobacterium colombiense TaxID=339268 RepID=UPI00114F31A6|nr:hypothetical protein [Mycobacterium colombiense]
MTIDNPYWDAVKDCVETDSVGGDHAEGGLLDPVAGTGYRAYLLTQLGVDGRLLRPEPGHGPAHRWLARRQPVRPNRR